MAYANMPQDALIDYTRYTFLSPYNSHRPARSKAVSSLESSRVEQHHNKGGTVMLRSKHKKRQASISSVDLLNAASSNAPPPPDQSGAPSRAFNYLVERARGAVGFGGRERTRTTSDEGLGAHSSRSQELSSSPTSKPFFGRGNSTDGGPSTTSNKASIPFSASMQDMAAPPKGGGGAFFRRPSTTSNPAKPGWLAPTGEASTRGQTPSPLTSSPSSPVLSSQASAGGSEGRRKDKGIVAESGKKLAALSGSSSDLGNAVTARNLEEGFLSLGGGRLESSSFSVIPRSNTSSTLPLATLHRRAVARVSFSHPHLRVDFDAPYPHHVARSFRRPRLLPISRPLHVGTLISRLTQPFAGSPSLQRRCLPGPLPYFNLNPNLAAVSPALSQNSTEGDRRRDSQTIFCQGLLQRKGDYIPSTGRPLASPSANSALNPSSTSPTVSQSGSSYFNARAASPLARSPKAEADLQRGWKPYRAILKGSKLYLNKLPGDLSTTAKHLFPSTIVDTGAPSLDPSSMFGPTSPSLLGEDGTKRKQRAFWGTGASSHPGLVVGEAGTDEPRVQGGTMEALVYELVFGTSFVAAKPVPTVVVGEGVDEEGAELGEGAALEQPSPIDHDESPYDEFLSTLLLVWPALPFSASQSASELDRCAGLAVRTAVEAAAKDPNGSKATAEALATRLRKIVITICDKFPQDLRRTDKGRVVPSELKIALEEVVRQLRTLPVARVGGDALAEAIERTFMGSEGLKTKSKPLTEWPPLPAPSQARSASSNSGSPTKTRKRLPSEQELQPTLTAQSFLQTDPLAFAAQIHIFHLDRLAAISGNISTPRHLLRTASLILSTDPATKQTAITSLFSFSPASPHFLTRIVLQTILSSTSSNGGGMLFSPANASSPCKARAAIIAHWITVGEELKRRGDAAGWVAVASALCCRAIARLEDTWRSLPANKIEIVREQWAPTLYGVGFVDFEETRVGAFAFEAAEERTSVPFLGSVLEETVSALRTASTPTPTHPDAINMGPLYRVKDKLDVAAAVWTQEPLASLEAQPDHKTQFLLQASSRLGHPDKAHLSVYLTASLEAEPRPSTQHLSLHYKTRSPTEPSPILPLLMVEPLPHITLIDREKIISSGSGALPRKQSTPGPSAPISAPILPSNSRLARHNSYPPSTSTATDHISMFTRLRDEIATPSDTLLRFADGDIVFRIVSAAAPALPLASSNERGVLSRTSSWIESRSSRTKSARTSLNSTFVPLSRSSSRRESSPTSLRHLEASAKLQVAGEEEPVHVVVKAGTVETLVDLLVLGTGNLRTPSTDADGQSSLTGRRPLSLNMGEYRAAFFATFRSFSSALVVLDMLRKRYLAAPNAALEYVNLTPAKPFPTWSMAPSPESDDWDWERITNIRLGVLKNLRYWMEQHVGDFLDDDDLWSSALTFLQFVESTEQASAAKRPDDDAVLAEVQRLRKKFGRESLRPAVRTRSSAREASGTTSSDLSFDKLAASELVDRLDQVACRVTRDLTDQDLLRYIEVLETSTLSDPAAWYPTRSPPRTDEEDLVIADTYSHTSNLANDTTLARRMPISLQNVLSAHSTLRRWLLAHLVDPDLNLRQRQARMLKAVEMLEVCRSRMSNVFFGGEAEAQSSMLDPSLASFVERAITSAVVSPESRLFASAWSSVASSRGIASPDSLAVLLQPNLLMTDATATLDIAWLNERLVEIATQVDSLSEGISINFSKRRWIYNTIRNALAIRPSQPDASDDVLQQMERRLSGWGNWGQRILRDVASGEGTKATKSIKPFSCLVSQQQEKARRDKATRDLVSKGQKLEQQGRLQREKEVAKAMEKSVSVRTRRMTSLFRVGRPLSAFNTSSAPSPPLPPAAPSAHALNALREWVPHTKPYLVLTLSGVEVSPYDNSQRSFVMELSTEDGQRSLFQAPSRDELNNWIAHFKKSGTQIAFRRATFLAQTALAEEPEETATAAVKPPTKQPASTALFSVPLWYLLQREGSTIPVFVDKAVEAIEERGLSEVGIYRISGENRVINELKEALNRGGDPGSLLANTDVHNVTGLLKLFLREMPEPLIPFELYDHFIAANAVQDYDERLYAIRDLVWKMPQPNFHLTRRLTEHLDKVTDNEDVNAMHAGNLSIIFAPTLLKPPPGPAAFGLSMSNLGQVANIVKSLVLQQAWIFGEEVGEEEAVQEVAEEELAGDDVEREVLAEEQDRKEDLPIGLGLNTDVPEALTKPIESIDTPISPVGAVVNFGEEETLIPETPLKEVDQTALVPTPLPDNIAPPPVPTTFAPTPNGMDDSTIRAASTPREMPSPSQWFSTEADGQDLSLEFSVKAPPPPPLIPPPKVGEAFIDSLSLPSPISESLFAESKTTPTP
ncbi:hypothetical protein BCR35DRAFT_336519 [Leucosporidium creatinivorum]|uniref:Uncharacterized protein n=1 Tax=Leucosporidium creatinivorum TaxID=106004 RepID=A0A1Y2BZ26_9BASI|nr:hypothetical protein BCR35DRAFT_336519 [Leucosporidium creatinivorum]